MEVTDTARKHGISDEDMRHAIDNALRLIPQDDDRVLVIGPGSNGALLEVIYMRDDNENEAVVIHAMALRKKFHRHLRR